MHIYIQKGAYAPVIMQRHILRFLDGFLYILREKLAITKDIKPDTVFVEYFAVPEREYEVD